MFYINLLMNEIIKYFDNNSCDVNLNNFTT